MEDLIAIGRPAVTIAPEATVQELAALLIQKNVGAAVVLEGDKLVGIVSERDIVGRAVAKKLDPEKTRVSEIMTADVKTARGGDTTRSALETMLAGHFRHLPVTDENGIVRGMLSVRHLLREELGVVSRRNIDLENFIAADGAGG